MQPLKIIIRGRFWDSQVYAGRLYLFGTQGDIVTINWYRLIAEWNVDEPLKLAMQCAFCRSDYLYGNQWSLFFTDDEVKNLIQRKFTRLADVQLVVSQKKFKEVILDQQDTPFPFPHADSTIYNKKLYVASSHGVYSANCNKRTLHPISTRIYKHWDAPVLALAASYNHLALAAGEEGLYELPIENSFDSYRFTNKNEPEQLSQKNCIDCRWTFYSIYSSSHVASGCLASFVKEREDSLYQYAERKFERVIDDQEIFHRRGYSWGTQDKLCQARNGTVHVIKYSPWEEEFEERFHDLGTIQLAAWKGDVVSGGTALFGTIIECDNAVVIVPSEGHPITLSGEPVNWRIFPRSKHYENQLHVIYEDRIEILSFNHDYFVDQEKKRSGFRFTKIDRSGGKHAR